MYSTGLVDDARHSACAGLCSGTSMYDGLSSIVGGLIASPTKKLVFY